MSLMTTEEKVKIIRDSLAAQTYEEEMALIMKLPLDPGMAKVAKEILGVDGLKSSGFDLSEANAEYGNDWLDN